MQHKKSIIFATLGLFILSSLNLNAFQWPWAKQKGNQLILQGSTTVLPIAQKAAERFSELNPDANVSVRGGGSGVGIAALMDQITDIAMASRPMKNKEIKDARSKGVDPVAHTIAKDGIAIIVNPSNSINELSLAQVKAIYTGEITNWKDLGGPNEKIVIVSRDTASGTFECFETLVMTGAKVDPSALMEASNQAVATIVSQTVQAIGYVGMGYLRPELKALKINKILPTKQTVLNGQYLLSRPLFMYTNGEPTGLTKKFIDFVLSPQGQEIVEQEGFVAIK